MTIEDLKEMTDTELLDLENMIRAEFADRSENPDYYEDNMTDVEADADTLASAGWGTDEDYGHFGDDGDMW